MFSGLTATPALPSHLSASRSCDQSANRRQKMHRLPAASARSHIDRDIFRRRYFPASLCLKRNNMRKTFILSFDYDTNTFRLFYKHFVFSAHGAYYTKRAEQSLRDYHTLNLIIFARFNRAGLSGSLIFTSTTSSREFFRDKSITRSVPVSRFHLLSLMRHMKLSFCLISR